MSKIIKRPWGAYVVIAKSKDFLLKKINVKPGDDIRVITRRGAIKIIARSDRDVPEGMAR